MILAWPSTPSISLILSPFFSVVVGAWLRGIDGAVAYQAEQLVTQSGFVPGDGGAKGPVGLFDQRLARGEVKAVELAADLERATFDGFWLPLDGQWRQLDAPAACVAIDPIERDDGRFVMGRAKAQGAIAGLGNLHDGAPLLLQGKGAFRLTCARIGQPLHVALAHPLALAVEQHALVGGLGGLAGRLALGQMKREEQQEERRGELLKG